MNIFIRLRERAGMAVGAVVLAACMLASGAFLTFYVSPQQALEWRRIQALPELDAAAFSALSTGEEAAITGTLAGNAPLTPDGFVAYETDRWDVSAPVDAEDEPDGSWTTVEKVFPALVLQVSGGELSTVAASSVKFGGALSEVIVDGNGKYSDNYEGRTLRGGALRTRGITDGEILTVVGQKATTGGIAPDRLYAGDRVQLVDSIRSGAKMSFIGGIAMMICAPVALIGGILGALFGRRR